MTRTREQLLRAVAEMSELYPEWRLGQLIDNVVGWVRMPKDVIEAAAAGWDVEDEELLAGIEEHLRNRRAMRKAAEEPATVSTSSSN